MMSTSEEIISELEIFYRAYIEIFNRQDADGFVECFANPYAVISGERGLITIANDDDNRKSYLRTMTALKQRGWARSGIDNIKAWAMANNLAMIVSDVTRYKTDHSVLEKVRACYTVRREGDGWKIMTLSEIKPPFTGPGGVPYLH